MLPTQVMGRLDDWINWMGSHQVPFDHYEFIERDQDLVVLYDIFRLKIEELNDGHLPWSGGRSSSPSVSIVINKEEIIEREWDD